MQAKKEHFDVKLITGQELSVRPSELSVRLSGDMLSVCLRDLSPVAPPGCSTGEGAGHLEWETGSEWSEESECSQSFCCHTCTFESIVKVYTVAARPNWLEELQGSGFIVDGNRIITNAHCVADEVHIMVRKHGDRRKYFARVVAVGNECDLALLTIDSQEFWKDTQPLTFGGIPNLQDTVSVVGYPNGKFSLSVGVVSRIELQPYMPGAASLLVIQVDAAIYPGCSGGPAIINKEVVGVVFQCMLAAQGGIGGFIIPVPIILHFLDDVERNV